MLVAMDWELYCHRETWIKKKSLLMPAVFLQNRKENTVLPVRNFGIGMGSKIF